VHFKIWNTTQRENENLQDYMQHFNTSKDILESHIGGPIQLTKYVNIACDNESEIEGYTENSHFYTWKMQVKTNMDQY